MISEGLNQPPYAQGKGVSRGFAVGKAWVFLPHVHHHAEKGGLGTEVETKRFKVAQKKVVQNIEKMIEKTRAEVGDHEAEIFEAHAMMIQDEELTGPILQTLESENVSAEVALERAFRTQMDVFESADSEYMRERVLDLRDLKNQLLEELDPTEKAGLNKLPAPVILVAEDLTPSQTITMDRKNVLGMIIEKGGETSHTAIIARTMGIPAITGVANATSLFGAHDQIALDGEEGSIYIVKDPKMKDYFLKRASHQHDEKQKVQAYRGKPTITNDAHIINLYGNIGSAADAHAAKAGDAEGVGLFRTEFLFMQRNQAPTLDEQQKTYQEVLSTIAPKEVVMRTIDIGGDKAIPFIHIPKEENPFLGMRAFRYCLKDLDLFKTQIKAMLLANATGNLSIMVPMISRASEAKQAVEIIHACHEELKAGKGYAAKPYQVGVMVEIPSLIFEIQELKEFVSFVSVGTNDLLQYSVAVDRMNPELQYLYSPYNVGFLRMMSLLAKEAISAGLSVGICGELGGSEEFIPLWMAMGYQKLSLVPSEVLSRRGLISKFNFLRCRELLKDVLASKDEKEVKFKLATFLKRERNRHETFAILD
jgi:phosphotransferase system enzyme I (PtsI)